MCAIIDSTITFVDGEKKRRKKKNEEKNGRHSNAAQQNSYHGFTCTLDPRRLPGDANCYQDNKTQSEHT